MGIVGSTPKRAWAKAADPQPFPPVYDSARRARWPTPRSPRSTSRAPTTSTPSTPGRPSPPASTSCARSRSACRRPETADLLAWADAAGVVHAVCFNLRFYPQNQNAAALVAAGAIGEPRFVTGRYHQDWLLLETDWNWRLDAGRQANCGPWPTSVALARPRPLLDRTQVVEVFADLHTFVTERNHPIGEVETFGSAGVADDVERVREPMSSDDAAGPAAALRRRRPRGVLREPGLGRAQEHVRVGTRRGHLGAGVGFGGAGEPLDRAPRAGERGRGQGPGGDDAGRSRRAAATQWVTSRAIPTRSAPCSPRSTGTWPRAVRPRGPGIPPSPTVTTRWRGGEAVSASARSGTWCKVERT